MYLITFFIEVIKEDGLSELFKIIKEDIEEKILLIKYLYNGMWSCLDDISRSELKIDKVLNVISYTDNGEIKYANARTGKARKLTDLELMLSDFKYYSSEETEFKELNFALGMKVLERSLDRGRYRHINAEPWEERMDDGTIVRGVNVFIEQEYR